ncbi:MAG: hypothetical protein QXL67_02985 [Candidatus Bathyarchaeia archaeon]
MEDTENSILKSNFEFENSEVSIVSTRDFPEIELGGFKVGPLEEGKEYKVKFWVAQQLLNIGLARTKDEDLLDSIKLYKIHWTERVQPVRQVSPLPSHFYPLLRWYLTKLKREAIKNPEKLNEYEKVKKLSQDILNCRLNKIIMLASSSVKAMNIIQNMTSEEKWLHESMCTMIEKWRSKILSLEEVE